MRHCPCLYDPAHGFRGYDSHVRGADGLDYDERNTLPGCPLCDGSGGHDPLPDLLAITDDGAAARWVRDHIWQATGPLRGAEGWHHSFVRLLAIDVPTDGVVLYNVVLMQGSVLSWGEIAEVFRPRSQQSLF
ncbi:MAG: hypothetical protein M3285_03000 [Actinomycetota bacterium]|nr:hypothetical protein [Actinomycetota bacterium]